MLFLLIISELARGQSINNSGFESPSISTFVHQPSGVPGWTFGFNSGISRNSNYTVVGGSNGQFAYLQWYAGIGGSISQTINLPVGIYTLSWVAAGRNTADGGGGSCIYRAQIDGGLFSSNYSTTGSQSFTSRSSGPITVTSAGNRTLTFTNTTGSGDNTCYIDTVSIASTPLAPTSLTGAAGSITDTGATLNGTVNPNGASTTVIFHYGTTTSYGSSVTASQSPVTGVSSTPVSAPISGLSPGTTYHYRVSATNIAGTRNSIDGTFTTPDTVAPTLSPVTIASHNPNPAWARIGDTVTLSFMANEQIQAPGVTLLGGTATVANADGNNWTANAIISAGTVEGVATFSISATDLAGNPAAAVNATTNNSSVTVDSSSPTLSPPANLTVLATSGAGAAVTFSATSTDNLDPSPQVLCTPASGSVFPVGTTVVNLSSTDAAGNSTSASFSVSVVNLMEGVVFPTPGSMPFTNDGFSATGHALGPVTLDFDPSPGQTLTLVNNTSANSISGAFTNLADGGTIATSHGGRNLLFVANYSGGDGNDLTLTLLNPEISVEQPLPPVIADGGSKSFGTMVPGSPVSLVFTIKNTGPGILNGLSITKSGTDQSAFNVTATPSAPVAGPTGTTMFTVQFNPATSGGKTAAIHIASDDADENPFDINLSGQALSVSDDTDTDGLNDAAEFLMSALGYDWQVSQPALVSTLMTNANTAGLFTPTQVQALHTGTPLISRNPDTGKFKLTMDWEKSTNLTDFLDFPAPPGSAVSISPGGDVEFEFPSTDNAAFYRIEVE